MIYDEDSLVEAGDIIQKHRLILIIGNQIDPVPLNDFISLRDRIYCKTGHRLPPDQVESLLFMEYEGIRLVTNNVLPHYNYLCLLRLIKRNAVSAIITTNYDNYLNSALFRYGSPFKGIRNPCISVGKWCCDGYYSQLTYSANEMPIWKIHGDLGFVRMVDCGHIFALPQFMIERPYVNQNRPDAPACCHFIVLHADGNRFSYDPNLSREHPSFRYKHHIDFGSSRENLFPREKDAACAHLLQHCDQGGAVFIIGMRFNPDFGEDLTDILLDLPTKTPIIYLLASKRKVIKTGYSELLDGLRDSNRPHIFINEVNKKGKIDRALLDLLDRIGETEINAEYTSWKKENKWWKKLGE